MNEMKDAYQLIADTIIKSLEKGVVPWRKTWSYFDRGASPKNLVSKKDYRGINRLLLMVRGEANKYSSPFWLTFSQCKKLGGYVKRGSVSTPVAFWKWIDIKIEKEDAESLQNWSQYEIDRGYKILKRKPMLKYYRVFNLDQTEGVPVEKIPVSPEKHDNDPIEKAEMIIDGYESMPEVIKGDPSYHPASDKILMPERSNFETSENYYSTLFHECIHSTGHRSRLKREGIANLSFKGSQTYSFEELIAEIGACFLNQEAGIKEVTFENSAAYVDNWLTVLRNDKKFVILAAAKAQKAADYILGVHYDE